jgi:tRNA threonylcarbamoyladenosine biosynthesis protein TsaB
MLTLALETATHTGGVALLDEKLLRGSIVFTTRTLYSQRLMPSIHDLLVKTGTKIDDVGLIGISIGPGSFTGLRIGLSVAKGLAFGCGAQMVAVKTLEALALRAACESMSNMPICCILDARQGQVYAGLYNYTASPGMPGSVVALHEDFAGPLEDVVSWIKVPALFAGDAVDIYREKLQSLLGDRFCPVSALHRLPHPEQVASLAKSTFDCRGADSMDALQPHYVRRSYMASAGGHNLG